MVFDYAMIMDTREPQFGSSSEAPHTPTQAELDDLFGPSAAEIAEQQAHISGVVRRLSEKRQAETAEAVNRLKNSRPDSTLPPDVAA